MINLRKEMTSSELENLIKQLENDDDVENSIIILQLIQLNLEIEMRKEEEQKKQKDAPKQQLKSKLDYMIAGFLSKPLEFLGKDMDVDEYVKRETGFSLLPKTKEERKAKAFGILGALADMKLKKQHIKDDTKCKDREQLLAKLKNAQKELELRSPSFER